MSSVKDATNDNRRSLASDQRGAIVLMGVFMSSFLVGGLWYLMGIGDAIVYRETVQAGVDSTAFTAAVYHARGMNVVAMVNIVIGAVLAILAASTVLAQMASLILSMAATLCDMHEHPGTDMAGNPLSYPELAFACEVIDDAEALMVKMTAVIAQVKGNTDDMLASLSTAQREVGRTAPWLGASQSNAVAGMHQPYLTAGGSGSQSMVPNDVRFGLPIQDDPFAKACDRGNSIVGKLAELLIPVELDPILEYLDWGEAHSLPAEVCMGKPGSADPADMFKEEDVCEDFKGDFDDDDGDDDDGPGKSGSAPGKSGGDGAGGSEWDADGDGVADDGGPGDLHEACEDDFKDKKKKHKGKKFDLYDEFDPNNKSTKGPYLKARNGDDYFQVYSVVRGATKKVERSNKGVEIPTWGGATVEAVGSTFEEVGVAQAEFYYDQTSTAITEDGCWSPCPAGLTWPSYRENVLWNLRWRARLRRYRLPTAVEHNVLTSVIPALGDVEFKAGLDAYNNNIGRGPELLKSNVIGDKTGEAGFIGPGTLLIH